MLGDPSQLPSPGRRDVFGTHLWRTFTILVLREIKRCHGPVLGNVPTKMRMDVCDEEVVDVLNNLLQPPDVDNIGLDRTIICSTRRKCDDINDECIKNVGEVSEYEAPGTDDHGHPLREADGERIQRYRERLPDKLELKVSAWVMPRRNMHVEGGWVNGTLAVVTSMHPNCVVIAKLANPSHIYPVPRFRQRIEIQGASYSILCQQFPLQLAYGVIIHCVQICTVQKAIVCLGSTIFCFRSSMLP